jgi:hypothetical protein
MDADPSQNVTDPGSLVSSVAEQVINDQLVRLYMILLCYRAGDQRSVGVAVPDPPLLQSR